MSEENENSLPAEQPKRVVTHTKLSTERLAVYLRVLRETGSHFEACRVATPFPNDVKPVSEESGGTTPPSGYQTFLHYRRTHPEFEQQCIDAINEAIGAAESELARRMRLPTERATIDKQGNVVHVTKDYRNADLLLLRFLARHAPDTWTETQKRELTGTMQVQHGNAYAAAGVAYNITSEVLRMLSETDRQTLGEIMCRAEDARLKLESEKKQQKLLEGPNNAG
jgi:hypothetical protein